MSKTGEYAFPKSRTENGLDENIQTGMTLRDWFAGQALTGIISSCEYTTTAINDDTIAKWAFKLADLMIEERKK